MSEPQPKQTTAAQLVGTLHEIRWSEICPWLILVKALRVTLMIRVLVLATIGVLLTQVGWATLDRSFSLDMAGSLDVAAGSLDMPSLDRMSKEPATVDTLALPVRIGIVDFGQEQKKTNPFIRGWLWMTKPFLGFVVDQNHPGQTYLAVLLYGLWAIVIWGVFGGAIARIAALYLTRGESTSPLIALRDAITVWPGTTGAPLIALLSAVALAFPLVLLGFLLRLNFVAVVVGMLWCLVLAWGLMLAVVLLGLLLGWPLMWSCLSVERSDAFDGVSRCYAYVYQRPLHLAFFILVSALLSLLGEAVVDTFASATVALSEETLKWGTSDARLAHLLGADRLILGADRLDSEAILATRAINGWKWGLKSLTLAYPLACLWPMAVGIYLLLRRQVDATEMDEVTVSTVP